MILMEKLLFIALTGFLLSASGTSVAVGDHGLSFFLAIVAGLSSIVGAMYYRAHDDEGVSTDLIITVIASFLIGLSIGGAVGQFISIKIIDHTSIGLPNYSLHIVGGGITGGIFTPLIRSLMNGRVLNVLDAVRHFFNALKGNKK